MKYTLVISLLTTTLLSGCFSESEQIKNEPENTVEYYLANEKERNKKIAYCDETPKRKILPNCINANRAKSKIERKKMMRG